MELQKLTDLDTGAKVSHVQSRDDYELQFVQMAREGFWMVDRSWRIVMINPRLCELLGYEQDHLLGGHVSELSFPEDHGKVLADLAAREQGKEQRDVVRYRRSDGAELWAEVSVRAKFDEANTFDGAAAVVVDVGDKLAVERELRATRDLIRTSAEVLGLGFWDADIETGRVMLTRELKDLFGLGPGAFEGTFESIFSRIHPEDCEEVRAAYVRSIETGEMYTFDYRVRTEGGCWRWVCARGRVIAGPQGRPTRSVGVAVCIDEYKQLEEQLLQSQRLESLGRLVSSVAHDFNNYLSLISGYTELALSATDPESEAVQFLNVVGIAGTRAAELVKQLLTFAGNKVSAPHRTDLNQETRGLEGILTSLIGDGVHLVMNIDEAELFVRIDPVQYEQVLVNLAVNARDAMPEGGTLTISTGVRRGCRAEDEWVLVTVEDTGTGMDAATVERIFDPFFTSKDVGKGTGLGLSTCYGIVRSAYGQIRVLSEPGFGSRFELQFPRSLPETLRECA